jgi:frataxin-like iron-binding protein CyaY
MTQAEKHYQFIEELFEADQVLERFNEIEDIDFNKTSDDLLVLTFDDGSKILLNPALKSVEVIEDS